MSVKFKAPRYPSKTVGHTHTLTRGRGGGGGGSKPSPPRPSTGENGKGVEVSAKKARKLIEKGRMENKGEENEGDK